MKKAFKNIIIIVILVSVILIAVIFEDYLSIVLALFSVLLVAIELYQSRKISEANFLAELNTSFVTNNDYKKAYTLLDEYDFAKQDEIDLKRIEISNYLTFFEVFQLLLNKNTVTIDMLDDLFGYRFFIAVHNPYIQKEKLIKSPDNFRNLYLLEKKWMEYRKKRNIPIFHEEYSLSNVVDKSTYDRIINKRK